MAFDDALQRVREGGGRITKARRELLADLVAVCRPHARALGCEAELEGVLALGARTGAERQIEQARALGSLPRLVGLLAADFLTRA